MNSRFIAVGGVLACGLLVVPALAQEASAQVERVDAFEHLTTPRIDLGEGVEGDSPLRRACPASTDTCSRYWAYTGNFVQNTILPVREREIIILRTAWLSRGDYIWGRHDVMGMEAGLTAEEIARVTEGPGAAGWSDFDATLLRAADELHASRFVSDATWEALGARYDDAQRREVVMIVGNYTQLAMFQNTLGVQLPAGFSGLPDVAGAVAEVTGVELDFDFYRTQVEPIFLERREGFTRCVVCHSGDERAAFLEGIDRGADTWSEEQSRRNFESVARLVTPGDPQASRLLMHPLEPSAGGNEFHTGGRQFGSQDDPQFQTLAAWVRGETGGQ